MKEPWQRYMQIGVVHPMLFPECLAGEGPLLETLQTICFDPFFEAVDVGVMHDDRQRAECAALLRDTRLTVTFACQPFQLLQGLDINHPEAVERNRAVEAVLKLIPQARELGASRLAVMSGKNVPSQQRRSAVGWLIESLGRICRAAWEEGGLPVVLEIFDHDVDKKALIGPCALAAEVAATIRRDYPHFGLLHDLSHIYLCREQPARHFPLIREHLVAMHLGNSVSRQGHPLFGDTHPPFGIEGGDCDECQVRECLKTLFDIGFLQAGRRPVVAFEIRTPSGTDPRVCIANMKRTLARAWHDW